MMPIEPWLPPALMALGVLIYGPALITLEGSQRRNITIIGLAIFSVGLALLAARMIDIQING